MLAAASLIGCSSDGPGGGGSNPGGGGAGPAVGAGTIGPDGGSVVSADGVARIDVPAGALSAPMTIGIEPASAAPPGAIGLAYEVSPSGVTFDAPVLISIAFDSAAFSTSRHAPVAVATIVDGVWVALASGVIDTDASRVFGFTNHLSPYGGVALPQDEGNAGGFCSCDAKVWIDCNPPLAGEVVCAGPHMCVTQLDPSLSLSAASKQMDASMDCYEQQVGPSLSYWACNDCLRDCCTARDGAITSLWDPYACYCQTFGDASADVKQCFAGCQKDGKPVQAKPSCTLDKDACCGDGLCEPILETPCTCPGDCTKCGDGFCTGSEDEANCPEDCCNPDPATAGGICGGPCIWKLSTFCHGEEYNCSIPSGTTDCGADPPCAKGPSGTCDDGRPCTTADECVTGTVWPTHFECPLPL